MLLIICGVVALLCCCVVVCCCLLCVVCRWLLTVVWQLLFVARFCFFCRLTLTVFSSSCCFVFVICSLLFVM